MPEERLPKQLLVSALLVASVLLGDRSVGAWSDVVANDLKQCNLSGAWREQAQQRDSWRATYHQMQCRASQQASRRQRKVMQT